MVRKNERKYRKASSGKSSGCYDVDSYQSLSYNRLPEDRKTYASKVKSLIEKKHRSVGSYKKTSALRQVLSTFPKNVTKCWDDDEDGETFRKSDSEFEYDDPDLEEVYESQKLNFRRMISNLSKHIYEDSDFDSWSDLESNFSLIYEPSSSVSSQQPTGSPLWCHGPDDLDDVNLTLEKVKNLKNVYNTEDARKNGSTTVSFDSKKKTSTTWEFSCSSCDSWSYCTSSSCDTTSFLSTCSYCRTFQTVKESNVYIGCDNNPQYITSKNVINNNKNNIISQTSRNVTRAASSVKLNRHDSWTNSECSQTYEPISVGRMLWSSRIKQLKRKLRVNSFSKRSSEDYCDSWSHYSNFTSLPISTMSRTALKQDCHDGVFGRNEAQTSREWESVENVSLGLIYIPMDAPKAINVINKGVLPEFQLSKCPSPSESTFSKDTICDSPLQIGVSPFTKDNSHHIHSAVEVDGEDTVSGRSDDFDPFGSLESLIFEPKEVVFPEAIGRDNKLKASISISNISNRSVSEDDGQSTVTQHSERENEEPVSDSGLPPSLSQTKSSVMSSSGKCYGTSKSSLNSVGSYWDWGKNASVTTKSVQGVKKAELGNHQPEESQYVQREPAGNKEMDTDSSFASEQPRSSELSDSKTCAGTSVASWTYIGLSKVANGTGAIIGIGRPEEEGEADVNGDGAKTIDDSSSTSPCASFRTGISPKKEVTWKIISEQRNKDGLSELVCTAPSFQEHVPCKVIPSVAPLKGVAMPPSHLMDFYNCWSDLESLIFADESCQSTLASVRDVVIGKKCGATSLGHVGNRMNSYKDDWLFWDQQRKRRKMMLPNEDFTWRNKAKRMLLWMHYSQGDGGSPMEQWTWWKAKQRASILWLIGKANNNKIPDDLKDPYYKDHDDQDQLKPVVVHALASAEYYCLALGCIYADPNYHNLNHWGVIQALARKGVYVAEPSDVSLTETVLIQTSPIRMSAHMAVIEAIMSLYLKETITIDRIVNAVRRLVPTGGPIEMPGDIEEAMIVWINKVCVKMKHRIEDEMNIGSPEVQKSDNLAEKVAPPIPLLQDLGDLSDGCCLAAVVSYYCPMALHWQDICLNDPISMADSLYNLQLVQKFCRDHLPYDISFLTLEDLIYQHSSVRQNVLVFLAELFFTFEVRPAKCVRVYGSRPEITSPEAAGLVRRNGHYGLVSSATKRSFQQPVSPIPDLRNSYNSFPDTNRISPKSSASQREPLLPRRQLSQHERMQERSKRFSFTDGSRAGLVSPSGSMRRTHSMQDIDKNGAEKPYVEASRCEALRDNGMEFTYPLANTDYHGYSRKVGRDRDDHHMQDDGNELYLRPLSGSRDGEPLMPAIVRPSKEKTNNDSKPEEMGEYPRQNSAPTNQKSRLLMKKTSVAPDQREERQQCETGRSVLKPEHFDSRNINDDFYSNNKNDTTFTYPDNKDLEESLKSTRYSKLPFALKSDDIVRLKQGLESVGTNENNVFVDQDLHMKKDGYFTTSFAQLSKPGDHQGGGINIVYMQHDRDADSDGSRHPRKSSFLQKGKGDKGDKKTSFAALPNQTTWQQHQQGRPTNSHQSDSGHETPSDSVTPDAPLASQLYDVKLKLEEKRRHIEQEKRKMDVVVSKSRQKVGKAAFLQAVSKGKGSGPRTPDSGAGDEVETFHDMTSHGTNGAFETNSEAVGGVVDKGRYSPSQDVDDDYTRSIDQLNTSLGNLQADIQRLTVQQEQIQQLMKNSAQPEPQGQFYLHDHASHQETSTWMAPPQQRTPPQETLYHPNREPLYQGMQRSRSIEQLYQPLNVGQSIEPLYQPLHRTQSKEQLYQAPLQRTASREQLYTPQPLLHMTPGPTQMSWMHHMAPDMSGRQLPVGSVVPQQHAYVDQTGYILHQQPMSMNAGYQMAPQYLPMGSATGAPGVPLYPNGLAQQDQYTHFAQYPQHMLSDPQSTYSPHIQSSPYRLHIEVPGASLPVSQMPLGSLAPSSRSQSPMTFIQHHHQPSSQPSSRPPSRPPSVPTVSGIGLQAPSLPSKALPVTAPPESFMEPQLVHFIDAPSSGGGGGGGDGDNEFQNHYDGDEHFTLEQSRALASLDEAISGTGTYRIKEPMSPTRPTLGKTFRVPKPKVLSPPPPSSQDSPEDNQLSPEPSITHPIKFGVASDKGFFVSFDGEQPKRPKPPLRTKKVPKVIKSEDVTPEKEQAPEFPLSPYHEHFLEQTPPSSKSQSRIMASDSPSRGWKTPVKSSAIEEKGRNVFDEKGDSETELVNAVEVLATPKGDVGNIGLYIGSELVSPNPTDEDEMARKKERILMSVIKRKEQQEASRARKELEAAKRREQERAKQELVEKKKEDDRARRKAILEQYMQRKAAMEEQEGEKGDGPKTATLPKSKGKPMKPRPKSLHESALSAAEHRAAASRGSVVTSGLRGSQSNLAGIASENAEYGSNYRYTETDSGLGRATPPRRAPSPGQQPINRHPSSPTAYVSPPSLPPGLVSRRMGGLFSDTASDSCSTTSSAVEYTGPKLFKQPTAKSNRGIVINAINTVLAGAVNGDSKRRALEEIARSDSKHFLILFRDAGCQFRGLYSYQPEKDEVFKLFGTGPRQVTMKMFDKFFKYNCGGRNFTEIQTKHLTVTIDAFTIQNNLWQSKRVVPSKREYY